MSWELKEIERGIETGLCGLKFMCGISRRLVAPFFSFFFGHRLKMHVPEVEILVDLTLVYLVYRPHLVSIIILLVASFLPANMRLSCSLWI